MSRESRGGASPRAGRRASRAERRFSPAQATGAALALLVLAVAGCGPLKRAAYESGDRDEWQKPDEVIALLGLREGDQVADLGAGGGYFTFRLADAVGPSGRVYAVDVDEGMLAYLRDRAAEEGRRNIVTVRAEEDDPELPDGEIHLLFTSNTYHHLDDRVEYFEDVLEDLVPNGRVAIVEFDESGSWFTRWFGHNTPPDTIVDEMQRAGYRLVHDHDILERQSFLVFAPDDD